MGAGDAPKPQSLDQGDTRGDGLSHIFTSLNNTSPPLLISAMDGFQIICLSKDKNFRNFYLPFSIKEKTQKKAKLVFRTSQNYFSETKCFPYLYLAETIINRLPLNNFHLSKLLPVSQKYFLSLKIYWRCRCSGSRC